MVHLFIALAAATVIVTLALVSSTARSGSSARSSRKREALATTYRIHEITSAARAAMWDEVRRHRPGGS